jgi:uroporphyrinogen-III synthase
LFVSHVRIAQVAGNLGFAHVILTTAGDDGLLEGLLNYFRPETTGEIRGLEKP